MEAVFLSLLGQFWPFILAAVAALGWGAYRERRGVKKERAKQDRARLETITEAQRIDEAIAGRDADENRKELGRWGR